MDRARKESEEIEQILGKALGYPWYKDDPKNFPNATEADGVCVGVETAWSLAMIAADRIKELEERNKKLSKRHPTKEEALAQYEWLKANSKRNKETRRPRTQARNASPHGWRKAFKCSCCAGAIFQSVHHRSWC
jgi:hypothetical protein